MSRIAIDLDSTLVDERTRELLPGAAKALRHLARTNAIVLHTCRLQMPGGEEQVKAFLDSPVVRKLSIEVWRGVGKPQADVYVDNRAVPFYGDWASTTRRVDAYLAQLREAG